MTGLRRFVSACTLLFSASAAHACTVCDSQNGHALRAGLFNGHFLHTLLLVLAPAPVTAGIVALLHLAMPDLESAGTVEDAPMLSELEPLA